MLNQTIPHHKLTDALVNEASAPDAPPRASREELERAYLAACQRAEELIERKKSLVEEPNDIASLHQELDLIGSRIQRHPNDPTQDEDYLAVVRRARDCLRRNLESEQIRGDFQ